VELLRASRVTSRSASWATCALSLMDIRYESDTSASKPSPKKQEGYTCQETQIKRNGLYDHE
jgi:hypothetical protein